MHNTLVLGRKLARAFYHACALIGVVYLVVLTTPLVRWCGWTLAGTIDDPQGDVLIILGGSLLERDLIGTNSYWRAIYGTRAWREGGFRQVIVSGGQDHDGTIAEPIKRFLTCYGVPPEVVELEIKSSSTWENALRTRDLLAQMPLTEKPRRLVLLTSDYHMYRALRVFRKVGLDVKPRPFPDVIKRSNCVTCRWEAFQDVIIEVVKIGYYRALGRI
jgi:uncharacterized SAM-binding protein YcdF (DUF218 family)